MDKVETHLYQQGLREDMGDKRGLRTGDFCAGLPCSSKNRVEDGERRNRDTLVDPQNSNPSVVGFSYREGQL